jgi:hypothetical protein
MYVFGCKVRGRSMLFVIEFVSNKLKKKFKNWKKWSSNMGFDLYRKTYYAVRSLEELRKWTDCFGTNK